MIIKPYSNVLIDLAEVPYLAFYYKPEEKIYDLRIGSDSISCNFSEAKIMELKDAISAYYQQGGQYYWLFNNVAVNVSKVVSTLHLNNAIHVGFTGTTTRWTGDGSSDNRQVYDDFRAYVLEQSHQDRPQRAFAASTGRKPVKTSATPGELDEAALAEALQNIDRMIGLDGAKKDIRQNIALARFNAAKQDMGMEVKPVSRHMVFTGNPGTGKTTFAREVAKIYHALGFLKTDKVVETTREGLIAEYTGQTAPKVRKKMDEARGGVLFIDEAYSLVRDKSAFRDVYGSEAIDTLVAGMENMRDEMVVIVAGYPEPMKKFIDANEGLKSRFVTYISFEDYSLDQLGQIMDLMMAERGYTLTEDARDHMVGLLEKEKESCERKFRAAEGTDANGSSFGNARDARTLVEAAEKALALRLDEQGVFGGDWRFDDEERAALLSTITLEDVKSLSLEGIKTSAAPAAEKIEMGFARRATTP